MSPDLSWTLSPGVLIGSAILAAIYVRRWREVRGGGSPRSASEAPLWRLCCFMGAIAVTLIALVSPLDALADQLFLAHMVQHVLLLDLAPILAILGLTRVLLRKPFDGAETTGRVGGASGGYRTEQLGQTAGKTWATGGVFRR